MEPFISAVRALLDWPRVREVWLEEDVWTVVLQLLAHKAARPQTDLKSAVDRILKPSPVRVVAALANVTWQSEPRTVGGVTLARLTSEADASRLAASIHLNESSADGLAHYARQLIGEFGSCVVATASSPRQESLAHDDFERLVEDLLGLTLMYSTQLTQHGVFALRGATNRPGIRGLTLDRGALGSLLAAKGAGELAARVLSLGDFGNRNIFRWFSADPLPIDQLIVGDEGLLIGEILEADDVIAQRLRVAARWYARAFWSSSEDDAALAVSVALDSLLTGKEAVPSAVSKGRFALLERNRALRSERFKRYDRVYSVRNAIAHGGGASRALAELGGARSLLDDARWAAARVAELRAITSPRSDAELRDAWNGLQWGTTDWVIAD
ncbi:hypothetical protein NS206_05850 [Microbacterium testaceum]|nr:hypothetical protein NS206_05850 [Microbacterium testaceum]